MSVDPALVARASGPIETSDARGLGIASGLDPAPAVPPLPPAVVDEPGVILLNTRGYNYGPPVGEIEPRAMGFEGALARPAAR